MTLLLQQSACLALLRRERGGVQGDASNLVGCVLTGAQLPLTSLTAVYFVLCDVMMILQYTFYAGKARRSERRADARAQRERLLQAQQVAEEGVQAYNVANAYSSVHPRRHTHGHATLEQTRVHSVPSVSPPS